VAWGLVVVLAIAVLIGSADLVAHCQSHLPMGSRRVGLLPRRFWGFGRWSLVETHHGIQCVSEEWVRLGFFTVRVK
jgi:hypothetical protein